MAKTWYQTGLLSEDASAYTTLSYDIPSLSAGVSLLRSIVSIYAYGISTVPLALTDLAPGPIQWTLQEANTEVSPSFDISSPFAFEHTHVLAGGILTTSVHSGVTRFTTTGHTDEDLVTGVTTYSLEHADLPWSMVVGNGFEDSQAQRKFVFGGPTFQLIIGSGPLASYFSTPQYRVAATVKQLFET